MHLQTLGLVQNWENSSVYIECSVRKPGVNHPVREIVKRFGKKKDLLRLRIRLPWRRSNRKLMR